VADAWFVLSNAIVIATIYVRWRSAFQSLGPVWDS
jgi:hypothetical protein